MKYTHQITTKVLSLEDVFSEWVCPSSDCTIPVYHSFSAMIDVGNPICPNCDEEMELRSAFIFVPEKA